MCGLVGSSHGVRAGFWGRLCSPYKECWIGSSSPYSILATFRQGQWIKAALAQIRVSELKWNQLAQNMEAWKMSAGRSENKQKISDLEKRVKDLEEYKDRADNTMRGLKRRLDPMDKSIQVVIENHQDLEKIYQDAEHSRNWRKYPKTQLRSSYNPSAPWRDCRSLFQKPLLSRGGPRTKIPVPHSPCPYVFCGGSLYQLLHQQWGSSHPYIWRHSGHQHGPFSAPSLWGVLTLKIQEDRWHYWVHGRESPGDGWHIAQDVSRQFYRAPDFAPFHSVETKETTGESRIIVRRSSFSRLEGTWAFCQKRYWPDIGYVSGQRVPWAGWENPEFRQTREALCITNSSVDVTTIIVQCFWYKPQTDIPRLEWPGMLNKSTSSWCLCPFPGKRSS